MNKEYLKKFIGQYVRVDMLNPDDWEWGKLVDINDDYIVLKMSSHMKEAYMCKEKLISRRMITTITTFDKQKEKQLKDDFCKCEDEIKESINEQDEEKNDKHGVEIG